MPPRKRPTLTRNQKALLGFLRKKHGQIVTKKEILNAGKLKGTTWRVYRNNALYAPYLDEIEPDKFKVTLDSTVSDDDFRRQVTQTKEPGSRIKNRLARALVQRSKDNMVLALEAYNRPSLINRLDAFAMLFTTAWEQLLKAELIEKHTEDHIFKPKKAGRRRESIGLHDCLKQTFPNARDPVRCNIEWIAELRHGATHLVMPEVQSSVARLFQAGVLNYTRRFLEKTGQTVVPRQNVGLLVLVAEHQEIEAASLRQSYGREVAKEILALSQTIEDTTKSIDDERFSIPLKYSLGFSKGETADVTLVHATEAPTHATVFEKPVDSEKTHPFRFKDFLAFVKANVDRRFNSHDLHAALHKEKWKKSNNEFHYLQKAPDTPKYSQKALDAVVRKINDDQEYLERARTALAKHRAGKKPS